MSIVKSVYDGLTALTYAFVLDVAMKTSLLAGFTNVIYDLIQLTLAILWISANMAGWSAICIINRNTCRLSTVYRYTMFIVTPLMAMSYISHLYGTEILAGTLFLIAVGIILGLSIASYIGTIMLSNQFRNNVGRVGAVMSVVATITWLAFIPSIMEVGTAINAVGNALIIALMLQLRRRYTPARKTHR